MRRKPSNPHTAVYELTLKCNMRCIHCGSSAGESREKELATKAWNNITKELAEMNCKDISIIGGEPFLYRDWFDVARNIKEYAMKLSIVTNGWTVNEEIISRLRLLEPYTVAISIDGGSSIVHDDIRQQQGSFARCLNVLGRLTNANIPTTVVTTLHKKNIHDLPRLRALFLNKGIAWQLQLAAPFGRFSRDLMLSKEEFYAAALFIASTRREYSMKELPIIGAHCFGYNSQILPNINLIPIWRGCQAGISLLGIQSNGGVKGCLSLPDDFIEGNLKKRRLSDLWNDTKAFSYNRNFSSKDLTNECFRCQYGKKCKGGCLSVSTAVTGQHHGDPYCLNVIEKSLA